VSHADGTKFYLGNDSWGLVRFSGTEPILRLFVEADSLAKATAMIQQLREFVTR
jgi:phosphomannomutase